MTPACILLLEESFSRQSCQCPAGTLGLIGPGQRGLQLAGGGQQQGQHCPVGHALPGLTSRASILLSIFKLINGMSSKLLALRQSAAPLHLQESPAWEPMLPITFQQ